MTQQTLREKIIERIDFMADHWTENDSKPWTFGGWKEEVVDEILQQVIEWVESNKIDETTKNQLVYQTEIENYNMAIDDLVSQIKEEK